MAGRLDAIQSPLSWEDLPDQARDVWPVAVRLRDAPHFPSPSSTIPPKIQQTQTTKTTPSPFDVGFRTKPQMRLCIQIRLMDTP
ncbi:MAG: hypothetical protein H6727_13850 [Myxococcales bacterium]|nr:hypothetical protein [Myxococcales bacterium]